MKNMTRLEYVAHLRRRSSGFSRGASIYRGVTRHHQHGRWQARIGRVAGNKDLYLGTYSTQEEAAEAYDVAAIKFRGLNAVTNFDITRYDVEKIMESNVLLPGEEARRVVKAIEPTANGALLLPAMQQNGEASTEWRMVLHQEASAVPCTGAQQDDDPRKDGAVMCGGDPHPSLHSIVGLDDVVECEARRQHDASSGRTTTSGGGGVNSFSNSSSLVTSLGNSREGSPAAERLGLAMLYSKHPSAVGLATMSPWMQMPAPTTASSRMLRPPNAVSTQLPVFAAWADA